MLPASRFQNMLASDTITRSRQCQNWICPYNTILDLVSGKVPRESRTRSTSTAVYIYIYTLAGQTVSFRFSMKAKWNKKQKWSIDVLVLSRPAQGAAWPSAQIFVPSWHGSPQFSSPALHPPGRTLGPSVRHESHGSPNTSHGSSMIIMPKLDQVWQAWCPLCGFHQVSLIFLKQYEQFCV